jgi:hypothetical protein
MASPPHATFSEVLHSSEEISEELEFQKALLESLDENVLNRESAEVEIKAEILSLQKKLKAVTEVKTTSTAATTKTTDEHPPGDLGLTQVNSEYSITVPLPPKSSLAPEEFDGSNGQVLDSKHSIFP